MNAPILSSINPPLRVMIGVIWNQDKTQVLISKRLKGKSFEGLWEFPGGKIDTIDGIVESDVEALCRELAEELNIFITDFEHWMDFSHLYKDPTCEQRIDLIAYNIWAFDEEPIGLEGQEIQWIKPQNLDPAYFPKADKQLIEMLKTYPNTLS